MMIKILLFLLLPMTGVAQSPEPQYRKTSTGFVVVLKPGQKIMESLKTIQVKEKIQSASFIGLGSVQNVEMSFFDRKKKTYDKKKFPAFAELVSLNGSLSWNEGKPWPHAHVSIGDEKFNVKAGHLEEAETALTAEIFITTDPKILDRVRDEEVGAAFIKL